MDEFSHAFFEDSSKCWLSNKIKKSNGFYEYRCTFIYKNKVRCKKWCITQYNNFLCVKHVENPSK